MTSENIGVRDAAALAWAKSEPIKDPHHATAWSPLWQHLDDTGGVAGYLWDVWLAPSVRRLISAGLPDGEADGHRLVTWLAGIHDIGKISPAFAIQAPPLCDRMVRCGGYPPIGNMVHTDRSKLRHEIAGAIALDTWLADHGVGQKDARPFLAVVGGHHGDFPSDSALTADGLGHLYGSGTWAEARTLLLDRAAERYGIGARLDAWNSAVITRPAQMAITGLVIMADWIASSAEYFPLLDVETVPALPDARHDDTTRFTAGLRRLDLSPPWRPLPTAPEDLATTFRERFPGITGDPRLVQKAVAHAARTMTTPGLMIVEAPMGEGKTEAAFLAAEILAERTGATGCLIALPTQATSDAMFTRLRDFLGRLPVAENGTAASVALVHGKAALNDEYQDIRFPDNSSIAPDTPEDDGRTSGRRLLAVVDEWMTGRKRAALSSFVVGTIDQVLFAALRARHIMLRQLSLIGKVVVLDEVHAADVYMSQFLDAALEWLGAAGTPVVLMSATLTPKRRHELYRAYDKGRSNAQRAVAGEKVRPRATDADHSKVLDRLLGYPSVVATSEDGPLITELQPSGRATMVTLRPLDDDIPALIALLSEQLAEGGCAVVIRNTVTRVQETAHALDKVFPGEVTVAHSRFLATDRRENDAQLLELFGKPGTATRPARHVVVASQVVEQSLDVDFDLMVTDVAPVDLILQRLGRLHRHHRGEGESDRPAPLRRAQCWITGADWSTTPPQPTGGTAAIYGSYSAWAALAVLAPHLAGKPVQLPGDIAPLVAAAYGDLDAPDGWEPLWSRKHAVQEKEITSRQRNALGYLFGEPFAGSGSLLGASTGNVGNVDEDDPRGQACVRDGEDSLEVVVVIRKGMDDYRIPDWVSDLPGAQLPLPQLPVDPVTAKALARCTLRLPFALCVGKTFDHTVSDLENDYFEGWRHSPYLSGMLALVLDAGNTTVLSEAGYIVRYTRDQGLIVTKDEEVR